MAGLVSSGSSTHQTWIRFAILHMLASLSRGVLSSELIVRHVSRLSDSVGVVSCWVDLSIHSYCAIGSSLIALEILTVL